MYGYNSFPNFLLAPYTIPPAKIAPVLFATRSNMSLERLLSIGCKISMVPLMMQITTTEMPMNLSVSGKKWRLLQRNKKANPKYIHACITLS